jgi:hypothetical protein
MQPTLRAGHNDLGDFFYQRGDLQSAFKCYVGLVARFGALQLNQVDP